MDFEETGFEGLYRVTYPRFEDQRGVFTKPWLAEKLAGSFGENAETYFSSSEPGVIRGLHFQTGDSAQGKYVACLSGRILDIAVDVRRDSATYGHMIRTELTGLDGRGVLVPGGFAHGIYAFECSVIVNFCNQSYSPGEEEGVNWASVPGLSDLEVSHVSDKDAALPTLVEVLL